MSVIQRLTVLGLATAIATPCLGQTTANTDLAGLQGEWVLISAANNGQHFPAAYLAGSKRTARGDTTTVIIGGQLLMKARFVLDTTKLPKTVDYHILEGLSPGALQLGIYELKADTVRFCFGGPGGPRPTDFSSGDGDSRTCSRWERAKP